MAAKEDNWLEARLNLGPSRLGMLLLERSIEESFVDEMVLNMVGTEYTEIKYQLVKIPAVQSSPDEPVTE